MFKSLKRHAAAIPTTILIITLRLKCLFILKEFEFLFGEESLKVIIKEIIEEALSVVKV